MRNAAGLFNTQGVARSSSCDRRWLKGMIGMLHPSRRIGNATFAKDLSETLKGNLDRAVVPTSKVGWGREALAEAGVTGVWSSDLTTKSMVMPDTIHGFSKYDCPYASWKDMLRFA
jgi:hypothetical protein